MREFADGRHAALAVVLFWNAAWVTCASGAITSHVSCTVSRAGGGRSPSSSSCAAIFRHPFLTLRAAASCIRLLVTSSMSCLPGVFLAVSLSSRSCKGFMEELSPLASLTLLYPDALLLQTLDAVHSADQPGKPAQ